MVLLAWSASAPGAVLTWNGGGTDNLWSTPANWGGTAPNAGDSLFFGGTARLAASNDLTGDISFAGLTFNDGAGAFTLSGQRITLGGDVTNNDADLQTLALDMILNSTRTFNAASGRLIASGVLSGTGGLTKTGANTLTLSGSASNTYTGDTTVSGGTLRLNKSSGNAISGNLIISGGAKVVFDKSNQIADGAAVTMSGVGSVFNGDGVNSGWFSPLVETIGSLTITGGTFNSSPSETHWTITGAGSFTGGDGNTLFVGNSGTDLSFGSLTLTNMTATAGNDVAKANSFTLYGNSNTVRSTITVGSGGLTLDGSRLNLRRGRNAGTLGSRLVLDGNVTTIGSADSYITEDTAGGTVGTIGVELSCTAAAVERTFNIGTGANLTINVPITNGAATTASVKKTGAGTLYYTGSLANTYTGTTTIDGGILSLGKTAGTTAVAGNLVVNSGGTLTWAANNQIADTAGITVNGGSISGWSKNETIAFYTQNSGGAPSWGNTGDIIVTGALTLAGGNMLTVNSTADQATWSVGSAELTGADILIGGNNGTGKERTTFTVGSGGLTMVGRTITVNRGSSGAQLVLTGAFTGTGTNNLVAGDVGAVEPLLDIGNATRTFTINSGTTTVGLSIEGTGGLTKSGSGTLVLSGSNTYSGLTTISGGRLKITNAAALGSTAGATTISGSAQLEVAGGITVNEVFTNTGGNGLNNAGLIYSSSGDNVFTQAIDLSEGGATRLNVASGSSLTFTGGVNMATLFRKLGGGTLVFMKETTGLSGKVSLGLTGNGGEGGMLLVGHARGLSTAPIYFDDAAGLGSANSEARNLANPIVVATTGRVTLGTASTGDLTLSGNVTLNENATIAVDNTLSTLSGVVSGPSKSLTKTGAGTLVLSGVNSYSGSTTVSQGTLLVNGSHTGAGAYVVANGATLGGSQEADEVIETSSLTIQAGGILAPGNSIGTLHIDGSVTIGETAGLGTWLVEYDGAEDGSIDLLTVSGTLDITNAVVKFQRLGVELDGVTPYVFATYGSLIGSQFASIIDLPSGYVIDYAYAGNQIALVSAVPEPSSLVGLGLLGLMAFGLPGWRRRWAS